MGRQPLTTVEITLSGRLEGIATAPVSAATLAERVENEVRELSERLGLATDVRVHVSRSGGRRPLRLTVNGSTMPYPPDLLWQLAMEVTDPDTDGPARSIADDAIAAHCGSAECDSTTIAGLVADMIRDRPSALVDDAQAAWFAAAAGDGELEPAVLRRVVGSLLDLGVRPQPRDDVIEAVAASNGHVEDAVESAFTRLGGGRVEVAVSPSYRRVLMGSDSTQPLTLTPLVLEPPVDELFRLLEERLLVEWGIVTPDIVLRTADGVPDGKIVVQVNDRRSAAVRGLEDGDRLLLGGADEHLAAVGARAKRRILNPANTLFELVVVDSDAATKLGGPDYGTPPSGFAALIVYREIVANAHRLLGAEHTLYLLQDLEPRARELVHLVLRHFTIAEITQVLRALVRERIPPRYLPVVLERLARFVLKPYAPEDRLELIRRGLSPYVVQRFVRGEMGRHFYELSDEVEAGIASGRNGLFGEDVRDAVWSALRRRGDAPVRAGIAVRKARRNLVYELLAPELPELVVIGRSDLRREAPELRATIGLAPDG